jgi:hypothetical protein
MSASAMKPPPTVPPCTACPSPARTRFGLLHRPYAPCFSGLLRDLRTHVRIPNASQINFLDWRAAAALSHLRFTHNFRGALRGEYALPWLLPTWTLVEEQFYLVVTFAAISVAFERWLRSKILNTRITAKTSAMPLIESNLCSW